MLCAKCGHAMEQGSARCPTCGGEALPARFGESPGSEFSQLRTLHAVKTRLARKAQVGGGIVIVFGVLLGRSGINTDDPSLTHRSGIALIVLGALLVLAGTFARWFYLD